MVVEEVVLGEEQEGKLEGSGSEDDGVEVTVMVVRRGEPRDF